MATYKFEAYFESEADLDEADMAMFIEEKIPFEVHGLEVQQVEG